MFKNPFIKNRDSLFEKLKKNLLRTFYEFRKRKNTDVKILDINYSTEKFIKIW